MTFYLKSMFLVSFLLGTWCITKLEKVRKFLTLSFSGFPGFWIHLSSVRELSLSALNSVETIFPSKVRFRGATATSGVFLILEFKNLKY